MADISDNKEDHKTSRRDFIFIAGGTLVMAGLAYSIGPFKSLLNIGQKQGDNIYLSNSSSAGAAYMDGVLSSVCCDLDASVAESYTAGQTWHNLAAKPADGAVQTDYDFLLGLDETEKNDPAFHEGYWNTRYLENVTQFVQKAKSPPPLLKNMHKGDQSWWVAVAFRTPEMWTHNAHNAFFGNIGSNFFDGIKLFYYEGQDVVRCKRTCSSPPSKELFDPVTAGQLKPERDYLLIVSHDGKDQQWRAWLNSSTPTNVGKAGVLENQQEATEPFGLMAGDAVGSNTWSSKGRFYHMSCGNEFLGDDQAALIKSHLEARHGRQYV